MRKYLSQHLDFSLVRPSAENPAGLLSPEMRKEVLSFKLLTLCTWRHSNRKGIHLHSVSKRTRQTLVKTALEVQPFNSLRGTCPCWAVDSGRQAPGLICSLLYPNTQCQVLTTYQLNVLNCCVQRFIYQDVYHSNSNKVLQKNSI